jgi:DNA-binding FrmR family transcriptional regulator
MKEAVTLSDTDLTEESMVRVLNRLARAEGQIRGVQRMIQEGRECEQVLVQLAAVRSALDGVGINIISHHMKGCLQEEMAVEVEPQVMEKAFEVFLKYVRCIK